MARFFPIPARPQVQTDLSSHFRTIQPLDGLRDSRCAGSRRQRLRAGHRSSSKQQSCSQAVILEQDSGLPDIIKDMIFS